MLTLAVPRQRIRPFNKPIMSEFLNMLNPRSLAERPAYSCCQALEPNGTAEKLRLVLSEKVADHVEFLMPQASSTACIPAHVSSKGSAQRMV